MNEFSYSSLVESKMSAQTFARLDIMIVGQMLGRYQSNLGITYWNLQRKFYINYRHEGLHANIMLIYRHPNYLKVVGYSPAHYARCLSTKKIYYLNMFFF